MTVSTDPETGRPAEEVARQREAAAAAENVGHLQQEALWADAVESAGGQKLLQVVEEKLVERILILAAADAQAGVYMGLLATFRGKVDLGRLAREELLKK